MASAYIRKHCEWKVETQYKFMFVDATLRSPLASLTFASIEMIDI